MSQWKFVSGRCVWSAVVLLALAVATPVHTQQNLRTQAEESNWTAYTRHDNMMTYMRALQATTRDMRTMSYGKSREGRDLPLAVFARPMVHTPEEALISGKPILMFQTNVHGGERTQRESILQLMRELVTPGSEPNKALDQVILLIAPQINPDGFEASQNGQRGNLWGIDLNRDYIKLEQPEIANVVTHVYHRWYPHLIIDGHNGGARPYNMNYVTTANASVDQALVNLSNNEIFQHVRKRNEEAGLKAFFYPGGNAEFWQGVPHYPRIGMTYATFMNSLGITFESPAQTMETGVKSGLISYKAVLEWSVANKQKVLDTVANARRTTVEMGLLQDQQVMVDMEQVDHDFTVSYEIPDPANAGQFITVPNGKLRTKPSVLASRPRPYAYILPREAVQAVALLRQHNITVEVLRAPATLTVQAYELKDVYSSAEYDHQGATVVTVAGIHTVERTFPVGTHVISTAQMLGRLVAHLLEPESDDNVILWNRMDAWLPTSRIRPTPPGMVREAWPGRGAGPGPGAAGAPPAGGRGAAAPPAGAPPAGAPQAGGRGGRGGAAPQPPLIPIFKLMNRTPLPTHILQ
jgi:dipeptidyl-peptidase-4